MQQECNNDTMQSTNLVLIKLFTLFASFKVCMFLYIKARQRQHDIREEFVEMEKEKERRLQEYREKKLGLLQNMMDQQNEMIQLQRRSTEAMESLVVKFPGHLVSPMSPFSVSPVIKFL